MVSHFQNDYDTPSEDMIVGFSCLTALIRCLLVQC